MSQVNLLPWREQARQAKKMRFIALLGACIGITIFFLLLLHLLFDGLISSQEKTNEYLQTQLDKEQGALLVLSKKKKEQMEVDSQLHFIFSLRDESYSAVRLLDELARIVPEAILLIKISREGSTVTIMGKAESNLQVTQFMENIAKSHIFKQPVLTEISNKESNSGEERYFQLKVEQQE